MRKICKLKWFWEAEVIAVQVPNYVIKNSKFGVFKRIHLFVNLCMCKVCTHETKWGWVPIFSSSLSRKVRSVASPGLRHSSSCRIIINMIQLQLQCVKIHYSWSPVETHQYRYDSFVFLLNQVTDYPVVEELNHLPLRKNCKNRMWMGLVCRHTQSQLLIHWIFGSDLQFYLNIL